MSSLPYRLDRTVSIRATPEIVFAFLSETPRWAAWWGAGSTIDARPGGALRIRYPDGTEVSGDVVDIHPPERIVFTYGYVTGKPIAPGASRVTIRLEPDRAGTRVHLTHEFAEAAVRDLHVQGWRYQLSVFGNVVADAANAGAAEVVDAWFDAWADTDVDRRKSTLERIADPDVRFRDRFSNIDSVAELLPHLEAAQRFMPGLRMHRSGDIRHCQGTVVADWIVRSGDGLDRGHGTNVFELTADGRIQSVTGFWM